MKKGDEYGRLTAIKFIYKNKLGYQCWLFKCSCGNKKVISINYIRSGVTKSCGCFRREQNALLNLNNTTHGMSKTRTYISWQKMKGRCLDKDNRNYKWYGARGIKVCKRWLNSFKNFLEDMGERPSDKTLDRINNDGNYCKNNCKWSTKKEQMNNTRKNIVLIYKGKTQTAKQWADELDINYNTIRYRIKKKWNIERILLVERKRG